MAMRPYSVDQQNRILGKVARLGELNITIMNMSPPTEVGSGTRFAYELGRQATINERDRLRNEIWALIEPNFKQWEDKLR